MDNENFVQCKICDKWFKRITNTHLNNKHDISTKKYKKLHPNSKLTSNLSKKKSSNTWKNKSDEEMKKIQRKKEETCLKRYGVKNPFSADDFLEKSKKTKLKKYGDENFINLEKRRKTCLEKYGVDCASKSKIVKEKKKQTLIEKYGVDHYSKTEKFNKAIRLSWKNKSEKQIDKIVQKRKNTCLEKYGVDNPAKTEEIKNELSISAEQQWKELSEKEKNKICNKISKSSAENILNGHKSFTSHNKGYYTSKITNNEEYYHSSWELKRMKELDKQGVNWTKKHNIIIKYKYEDNRIYRYIPDFLIENKIVEEVKPAPLIKFQTNKLKAAVKWCNKNNFDFKIIAFENNLNRVYIF